MSNNVHPDDSYHMARAIELAARGEGRVEPNPMVGCVIVREGVRVAEGWHRQFGGPHAEMDAMRSVASGVAGATMYVTLEPCCHTGKTPPCTDALIDARIARVVVAQRDPFPAVAGKGIQRLQAAGIDVTVGVLEAEARALTAPYHMLVERGRPWIMAKWAMTLDGKIASRTGHSRWISSERSRQRVHQLRGRVDAILVGLATAVADDPLLIARPPGPRVATRIVVDSAASLPLDSQLVKTCDAAPVLVAIGPEADESRMRRLRDAGCDTLVCPGGDYAARMQELISELGRRRMTNVLVEGGGQVLGTLFDQQWMDEVHVFVAPKIVGGEGARVPVTGVGREFVPSLPTLRHPQFQVLDQDVYISGRLSVDRCEVPRE